MVNKDEYRKSEPDLPAEDVALRLLAVQADDVTDAQEVTHCAGSRVNSRITAICHGHGPRRRPPTISRALQVPLVGHRRYAIIPTTRYVSEHFAGVYL